MGVDIRFNSYHTAEGWYDRLVDQRLLDGVLLSDKTLRLPKLRSREFDNPPILQCYDGDVVRATIPTEDIESYEEFDDSPPELEETSRLSKIAGDERRVDQSEREVVREFEALLVALDENIRILSEKRHVATDRENFETASSLRTRMSGVITARSLVTQRIEELREKGDVDEEEGR